MILRCFIFSAYRLAGLPPRRIYDPFRQLLSGFVTRRDTELRRAAHCRVLEAEILAELGEDPFVAERIVGLLHPVYEPVS